MTILRNPDQTRARLIEAAFDEIYQHGYQGMRVDEILARTGLKKGALYHHFPSKAELAYAVIDEVIFGYMENTWLTPLRKSENPIDDLKKTIQDVGTKQVDDTMKVCGCPLNNLAQEMSPLDENIRTRIQKLYQLWIDTIAEVLHNGQRNGKVRKGFDPRDVATYIVATLEGCISLLKASQDQKTLNSCWVGIEMYLESLRA